MLEITHKSCLTTWEGVHMKLRKPLHFHPAFMPKRSVSPAYQGSPCHNFALTSFDPYDFTIFGAGAAVAWRRE